LYNSFQVGYAIGKMIQKAGHAFATELTMAAAFSANGRKN